MGWDAGHGGILFHVLDDDRASPNGRIVPDFDVFHQTTHGPEIDAVPDDGRCVVVGPDI